MDWSWSFSPLQRSRAFLPALGCSGPAAPGGGRATEFSISGDCNVYCGPFFTEETSCDNWRFDALWGRKGWLRFGGGYFKYLRALCEC
ncbi:hypothetical protein B0T18DRAFT_423024 [Schizothecium vesticola]|uniref:Uncharacterized protein n=1 Tax=Schizothecium vesticola TaxID=314040 RepID=A0AA40BRF9_9PEZI|nr:hypothetical protein B0T18DRAFT_423024 [Schizothecium vesticola]